MKKRVLNYIREHDMIRDGELVCVACSGGADSICLLTLLHELRAEGMLACDLMACHLNHGLRGAESDGDLRFVEAYCDQLGIPLVAREDDVAGRAAGRISAGHAAERTPAGCAAGRPGGLSGATEPAGLEQAGREAREALYRECVSRYGADRIALAHHMNDQAETVLFHLARGASLKGFAGMRPVNGYKIRPLLCVRRDEAERWLAERSVSWREDRSNRSDDYARNRIRHHILPALEGSVNAGAVRNIAAAAELMRMADDWIAKETNRRAAQLVRVPREDTVEISAALADEEPFLQYSVIMEVLCALGGTRGDLTQKHVRQVADLLAGRVGRRQDLPRGITAVRTYEGVSLMRISSAKARAAAETAAETAAAKVLVPGRAVQIADYLFTGRFIDGPIGPIPEKAYTKWLNCDKLTGSVSIRTRRPGDYIVINERGDRQSVKAWMINHRIPRMERDQIPLLVAESDTGEEVLWIVGGRISARARVGAQTKRILQISAERITAQQRTDI